MNRKRQVIKYIIADYLAAFFAWGLFFIYRKYFVDKSIVYNLSHIFSDINLYIGQAVIPFMWLGFYTVTGTYEKIYRKSRLKELGNTLLHSIIGVTLIFFFLILDDVIISYKSYYFLFLALFCFHFFLTYFSRLIITTRTIHKIHRKAISFNTLIIGCKENAVNIYEEIENQPVSGGNKFIGFVNIRKNDNCLLSKFLPHHGSIEEIRDIIRIYAVEEVILAMDPEDHSHIDTILTDLEDLDVLIKITPEMKDILLGSVKMTSILQTPLIIIYPDLMPDWQNTVKRVFDIVVSSLFFIIFSPLLVFLALGVKLSSKGSVIYSQVRVGYRGKPFMIHKFRSMYDNAEENGPQLSNVNDKRITRFGRFMRKYRMDELPQFYNVLKGEMSLVGPRPERQYFIDQIVKRSPQQKLLTKVKPGITSWGQIKFGYAENVDQMVERLKFDLLYIENMSLATDFKILIYTVLIILQGKGK